MRKTWLLFLALSGPCLSACGTLDDPPRIRLATTTSTDDSGLLEFVLPPFEAREGVKVDRIAVGTGQALALGRRGDADLVLVHARTLEDEFVAEGWGIDRRDVMWNDFVIAGPAADSARVADATDAAEALRRIAAAKAKFISRGDDSGTHTRELELWKTAGIKPAWSEYKEVGQGMGSCLIVADQTRGYVLADRGTYLALGHRVDLAVLVEGDPGLRNPYGAILVNPDRHPHVNADGARRLLEYLTSPEGQAKIAAFRVDGQVLFHPNADH
jgi:tungstate transport system substrate-binding protein